MTTLVSHGSELLPYSSKLRETGWCLETSLRSNVLCLMYRGHLKKKCSVFSTLPQLHNGDSDMFLRNRSLFNEPQFARKRVCKICDFRLLAIRRAISLNETFVLFC